MFYIVYLYCHHLYNPSKTFTKLNIHLYTWISKLQTMKREKDKNNSPEVHSPSGSSLIVCIPLSCHVLICGSHHLWSSFPFHCPSLPLHPPGCSWSPPHEQLLTAVVQGAVVAMVVIDPLPLLIHLVVVVAM